VAVDGSLVVVVSSCPIIITVALKVISVKIAKPCNVLDAAARPSISLVRSPPKTHTAQDKATTGWAQQLTSMRAAAAA